MLCYIKGEDLCHHSRLARTMFEDRAEQFHRRMGWDVTVSGQGEERDQYDALNPLYVIWRLPCGRHGGSMRFLPMTGRTMVQEHFPKLLGAQDLRDDRIWECTRFCLGSGADGTVAAMLMLGGGELMRRFGLRHFVGVFDSRMQRIYRRIGASPKVLSTVGSGRAQVSLGAWSYDAAIAGRMLERVQLTQDELANWTRAGFAPGLRRVDVFARNRQFAA